MGTWEHLHLSARPRPRRRGVLFRRRGYQDSGGGGVRPLEIVAAFEDYTERGGVPFRNFKRTDLGNSERFIYRHGDDVLYCYAWGKFLVWTGRRWERDETGKLHRLAKATVRGIYQEAADTEDEKERKALADHAKRSEAEARIRAMLELAKSEVPISSEDLD